MSCYLFLLYFTYLIPILRVLDCQFSTLICSGNFQSRWFLTTKFFYTEFKYLFVNLQKNLEEVSLAPSLLFVSIVMDFSRPDWLSILNGMSMDEISLTILKISWTSFNKDECWSRWFNSFNVSMAEIVVISKVDNDIALGDVARTAFAIEMTAPNNSLTSVA